MNNHQESKLKRNNVLLTVFGNYPKEVASIPALAKSVVKFQEINGAISPEHGKQSFDSKGITSNKNQTRDQVAELGLVIAGALYSLADELNNPDLRQRMDLAITDFKQISSALFENLCIGIAAEANKNMASLAEHGIEENTIKTFVSLLDSYKSMATAPRNVIVNKSTATLTLDDLFTEADMIVENKFDKLMPQFKEKNIAFYRDYVSARILENRGSRSASETPPASPAAV